MGGASSNLRKMLSEEAARVRGERKEGESADLTLGELLKYQVPGGFEEDVRVIHPAVMWVLDRDKKGAFADEDLHEFAQEMGVYTNAWMRVDWTAWCTHSASHVYATTTGALEHWYEF